MKSQNRVIQEEWNDALGDFLRGCQGKLERNTVLYYRYPLEMLARWAAMRDLSISGFTRRHMREYLAERAEAGKAPRTRRADVATARLFFSFLLHEEYVDRNPLEDYELPKVPKKKPKAPSTDWLRQFFNAIDLANDPERHRPAAYLGEKRREFYKRRDRAIFALLVESGARPGEVCAITLDKWNPNAKDGPQFTVSSDDAKDDEERVVQVLPKTARLVRAYLQYVHEARHRFWHPSSDRLFHSWDGEPLMTGALSQKFRHYCSVAGLKGFHLYKLKHYGASTQARVDIWAASIQTGVSIATLRSNYLEDDPAHVRAKLREADPLGRVLR